MICFFPILAPLPRVGVQASSGSQSRGFRYATGTA